MKEHQRYFPVKNQEGELLPFFVTVRNGDHKHLKMLQKEMKRFYEQDFQMQNFSIKKIKTTKLIMQLKKLDNNCLS